MYPEPGMRTASHVESSSLLRWVVAYCIANFSVGNLDIVQDLLSQAKTS